MDMTRFNLEALFFPFTVAAVACWTWAPGDASQLISGVTLAVLVLLLLSRIFGFEEENRYAIVGAYGLGMFSLMLPGVGLPGSPELSLLLFAVAGGLGGKFAHRCLSREPGT